MLPGQQTRRNVQKMAAHVPKPAVHKATYGKAEVVPCHCNKFVNRHVTNNARLCHIHSKPQFSSTVAMVRFTECSASAPA